MHLAEECAQVPTAHRIRGVAADVYHVQGRRRAAAPQPLASRAKICVGDQGRGWPVHGRLPSPFAGDERENRCGTGALPLIGRLEYGDECQNFRH
jgi:hypothetical protein